MPKSNKRKGPPKGRPVGADDGKPRFPNFAPWEDLLLSKVWVSVSLDPSVGCAGQKRKSFWS